MQRKDLEKRNKTINDHFCRMELRAEWSVSYGFKYLVPFMFLLFSSFITYYVIFIGEKL